MASIVIGSFQHSWSRTRQIAGPWTHKNELKWSPDFLYPVQQQWWINKRRSLVWMFLLAWILMLLVSTFLDKKQKTCWENSTKWNWCDNWNLNQMLHSVEGCQISVAHPKITKTFQGYLGKHAKMMLAIQCYTWKEWQKTRFLGP